MEDMDATKRRCPFPRHKGECRVGGKVGAMTQCREAFSPGRLRLGRLLTIMLGSFKMPCGPGRRGDAGSTTSPLPGKTSAVTEGHPISGAVVFGSRFEDPATCIPLSFGSGEELRTSITTRATACSSAKGKFHYHDCTTAR